MRLGRGCSKTRLSERLLRAGAWDSFFSRHMCLWISATQASKHGAVLRYQNVPSDRRMALSVIWQAHPVMRL